LPFKAYWIWGDEARHLACAQSFPFNRMYNQSFFDLHPVFYPYMIRLFSLFFRDHIAAIAVSFFSSLVLFITVYRLFLFWNVKRRVIHAAMMYMAFNNVLLFHSRIPFRYELFVCLFFLSLYMYLKGISSLKFRYLLLSALFGGLSFMTFDMTSFMLIIALLLAFFVFGFSRRDNLGTQLKKIMPIILIALIYASCVLLPRFIIYSTHTYYAGGFGGRIEKVSEFGLKQLINPVYFPNSSAVWGKLVLRINLHLGYIRDRVFQLTELYKHHGVFIDSIVLAFIALPLAIMLFKSASAIPVYFKNRKQATAVFNAHRRDLYLLILILVIFYPLLYAGSLPRYSIASVPFLAYFFGKGTDILFSVKWIENQLRKKAARYVGILILIILVGSIMKKSHHFIFTLGRIEASDQAGAFLNSLPEDGVLTEGLLADALVYNCKKRVVALPRSPDAKTAREQTDLSTKVFDLHYAVVSEFYKIELATLAYPAVEYIQNTPGKFKLIKTIYERYNNGTTSNFVRDDDTFYIYEIIR